MGQNPSSQDIEQQYRIMNVREDGSILLQHKQNEGEYLLRQICSNVQEEINGYAGLVKKRQKVKSEYLLSMMRIRKKEEKQVCSILHKLYMIIEYPFKSLRDEINEKKSYGFMRDQKINKLVPKERFSEGEIWSILYSCCKGMDCLYRHKFTHESLTADEIFIDKDGMIKISDPMLLGLQKNYIHILKKSDKKCYISPEIMNFIDDCNFSFFDKEKSDVFTLGAIILEACLLESIQIYNVERKLPTLEKLPGYLRSVKEMYSEGLCKFLEAMLDMMARSRPSFRFIYEKIETENSQVDNQTERNNQSIFFSTAGTKDQFSYPRPNQFQSQPSQLPSKQNSNKREKWSNEAKQMEIERYMQPISTQNRFQGMDYNKKDYQPLPNNNTQPPSIRLPGTGIPKQTNRSSFNNAFDQVYINTTTFRSPVRPVPHSSTQNSDMFPKNTAQQQNFKFSYGNQSNTFQVKQNHQNIPQMFSYPEHGDQIIQSEANKKSSMIIHENNSGYNPFSPPTNNYQLSSTPTKSPSIPHKQIKPQPQQDPTFMLPRELPYPSPDNNKNQNYIKINSPQKSPGSYPNQFEEKIVEKQQRFSCSSFKGKQSPIKDDKKEKREYVTLVLNQGGNYSGYFENGKKNGEGKLEFKDGGYYIGEWKDDMMHGYGRLHYENGNIAYQGQWVQDQFNGIGQVFNDYPQKILGSFNYHDFADLGNKWLSYQGELKNDSKHGKGLINLSNGQIFQGQFVFDVINGEGTFYKTNGECIRGIWKDNVLVE